MSNPLLSISDADVRDVAPMYGAPQRRFTGGYRRVVAAGVATVAGRETRVERISVSPAVAAGYYWRVA